MKKFLAILLIAIVACSTIQVVDEEEAELQKLPKWIKKGWAKIKSAFKKVVTFLKDNKLWEPLVKLFSRYGKKYAQCDQQCIFRV